MRPERVVIGVDFAPPALEAARWTIDRFAPGAEHVLVHALDLRDPPGYLETGGSREELAEEGRERATRRIEDLADDVQGSPGTEVRTGRPDEVLSAVARELDADLIAVGRGGGSDGLLGGTAEKLVNAVPLPVLMVPRPSPEALEQILVAADDSPETPEVLSWACSLADQHDARAAVVHVFQPTFSGLGELVSGGESHLELGSDQEQQARAWLQESVREAGFDPSRCTLEILQGDPARQILAEGRTPQPDLVVTGSRGAGAVQKALLGSVASSILRGASRPVLVVRGS